MTHRFGGRRRRIPRIWLLPFLGLALILIAVSGGLVSRAALLDFVAWWPIWALLALLTYLARDARWGKLRASGMIPLVAIAMLGLFGLGYVSSWPLMPSAGLRLIGPAAGDTEVAALSARLVGDLDVTASSSELLYEVRPLRAGGAIGGPEAVERVQGAAFSVTLQPTAEPGLYTFSGWDVALSESVSWSLTLGGDKLRGDLANLTVSELNLIGAGEVTLGTPVRTATVTVDGSFLVVLPATAPVTVIGNARVPEDWLPTTSGRESPVRGDGWVISVSPGSTLVVGVR